jgi:hypothetical protein
MNRGGYDVLFQPVWCCAPFKLSRNQVGQYSSIGAGRSKNDLDDTGANHGGMVLVQ